MDPHLLARLAERQATDQWLPPGEASPSQSARLVRVLDLLDALDADLLDLVCLHGWSQSRAGKLLGISQPSVSYRMRRALEQARYYAGLPAYDEQALKGALAAPHWRAEQRAYLAAVASSGSVRGAARLLGLVDEPAVLRRRLRWLCSGAPGRTLPEDALARYRYVWRRERAHLPIRREYRRGAGAAGIRRVVD